MVGAFPVITLCGSTRFKEEFLEAQKRLTLKGNIVISVGLFGHSGDEEVWLPGTKEMLDDMHKRKSIWLTPFLSLTLTVILVQARDQRLNTQEEMERRSCSWNQTWQSKCIILCQCLIPLFDLLPIDTEVVKLNTRFISIIVFCFLPNSI